MTAGGWLALAWVAAVTAAAAILRAWHKRRAGDQPVPGADHAIALTRPPVPGPISPDKAASPRARPAPAPGHHTGRLTYAIRAWECGCILMFDGHGRITGTYTCDSPDLGQDPDEWLKGLTP